MLRFFRYFYKRFRRFYRADNALERSRPMSAFYVTLLMETAFYIALGSLAVRAASLEKEAGRDHASHHLKRAGFLYFGLAAASLLHNA
jgi:hypothetical protein